MHSHLSHLNYAAHSLNRTMPSQTIARQGGTVTGGWLQAAIRSWQRRKMIASLEAMDDWILRDIGIERGDIINIVNGFDDRETRMAPTATRQKAPTNTPRLGQRA